MASSWIFGSLCVLLWLQMSRISEVNGQMVCYSMDLVFVVDGSGSICDNDPTFNYQTDTTCSNWESIVQFVYNVVNSIPIGPLDTRVGLIIFETQVHVMWNLTTYQDKTSLLNAISNLPYNKGGQTNTTGALQVLLSNEFNNAGDRQNVNNTAIIITDGKPTNNLTVPPAIDAVHNAGIRTLVVGVTDQVDESTLKLLSSPPKEINVTYFMAGDYHTIDAVRQQLQAVACEVPTSPTPTYPSSMIGAVTPSSTAAAAGVGNTTTSQLISSPAATTPAPSTASATTPVCIPVSQSTTATQIVCHNAMDLAFVVDSSGSICDTDPNYHYPEDKTCSNWEFAVNFIAGIVQQMTIGPQDTRVAVITFATQVVLSWNLTAYTDKESLMNAIRSLPYLGGNTNTRGALNVLVTQVFNTATDRPGINETAIIITDGKPTDNTTVPAAIQGVHSAGIRTLVVGVTSQIDTATLMLLSSPPQQLGITYFVASNFSTIDDVSGQLASQTCSPNVSPVTATATTVCANAMTPSPVPQPIDCGVMDLCFVIDRSGSICDSDENFVYSTDNTCNNWRSIVSFVADVVNDLNIGPSAVRVAVVIFSTQAQVAWGLSKYPDKTSLLNAINQTLPYYKGGETDTTDALNLLNSDIFTAEFFRVGVSKTAIIITDGKPTVYSTVPAAVQAVHNNGIRTLAVGVTDQIDAKTLQLLSSPPQQLGMTYFIANDYRTISTVKQTLQSQTCTNVTMNTVTAEPVVSCIGLTDVAFVVDASGSICDSDPNFLFTRDETCQNWNFIVQFIHRIVATLTIGPANTQVALIIFASNARLVWGLNAYNDLGSLLYAIDNLQYVKGGTTDTTGGLNILDTQVFNTAADRQNAANLAIIITDGKPTVPSTVPDAIAKVHSDNIRTLVVGVTNSVDDYTLKLLSSPPQQINVTYFVTNDYSTIDQVRAQMLAQTCPQSTTATTTTTTTPMASSPTTTTTTTSSVGMSSTATSTTTTTPVISTANAIGQSPSTAPFVCTKVFDLCFLVDGSGSICDSDPTFNYATDNTCSNWKLILQFLHNIVNGLIIGPTQVRVALVTFATQVNLAWNLTAYSTKDALLQAIDSLPYQKGGETNTTGGLNVMLSQIFNPASSGLNVNKTAIIVTDGKPTDNTTLPAAINAVHGAGIKTLAVGVTNEVDDATLKLLSSPPQQLGVTYFMASNFTTLGTVLSILQSQTCASTS